jgi:hypothetical protein
MTRWTERLRRRSGPKTYPLAPPQQGDARSGADDDRVSDFEEWAYWPSKPYTISEQ